MKKRGAAPAAHARLYEHLCTKRYWPEARDGLLPLYRPSPTGAKRGRFEEACMGVYHDRIKRGTAGAHGLCRH